MHVESIITIDHLYARKRKYFNYVLIVDYTDAPDTHQKYCNHWESDDQR